MKISYNWLQTFFDEPLPTPEVIGERITFGAFEIEEIVPVGNDTLLDIKVLPDRAPDAFSHCGIAREVSVLLGISLKVDPLRESTPDLMPRATELSVRVEGEKRAPFYGAALMKGLTVGPSPKWLQEHLATIGQRSINNVVDATNYVMFELGSPLHAFDASKLANKDGYSIEVRAAVEGEKITVLGGTEYTLTGEMSVIADAHSGKALALAGVKGGVAAEVDEDTTDILLEGALFDAVRTRKTSQALKLRTDASHRFENGIAAALPQYGLDAVVALIRKIAGGELVGYAHTPFPESYPFRLGVSAEEVNRRLGTTLTLDAIEGILKRFGMEPRVVEPRMQVVAEAPAFEGVPYKHGASVLREAPQLFDCSSFTAWLFAQAGVAIPRISVDQYVWGEPITKEELEPGDLVFANSGVDHVWYESKEFAPGTKVPEGVDHLGMYLGGGKVIHSTRDVNGVTIQDMESAPRFGKRIVGYRRMVQAGEKRLVVTVPLERLDIRQPADLIEEIGRVYGYDHVPATPLPVATQPVVINPTVYWTEMVRQVLDAAGFTEIYTYSLRENGDIGLSNPLSADKGHLRNDLTSGMREARSRNEYYLPLTGATELKLYEIGHVFTRDAERVHVAIGVYAAPGKQRDERTKGMVDEVRTVLTSAFGDLSMTEEAGILEFDLSAVVESHAEVPSAYPKNALVDPTIAYTPISSYPFVLRDIALWVPSGTMSEDVAQMITGAAGPLLVRLDQFDSFEKEGRVSYAFHLVFQSTERTLSDVEVNERMDAVAEVLTSKEWEIR